MVCDFAFSGSLRRLWASVVLSAFVLTSVVPPSYAQTLALPQPGTMMSLSESFAPLVLKGMALHKDDPLVFDFIVDNGQTGLKDKALTDQTTKLVKYFLAGLAVPDKDLWVNLSPYEKDRTIEESLSQTDMGRDMLTQDYLLKQMASSLTHPDSDLGKKFWAKVYALAQEKFGTTDIPMDTFNKVWITPANATVYHQGDNVMVTDAHLKVMLESDYLAESKSLEARGWKLEDRSLYSGSSHSSSLQPQASSHSGSQELAKQFMREIILPVLEREVNEGKNFAPIRQIFHSLILANWYKKALKQSLLAQVYADSKKTSGIDIARPKEQVEAIYNQYLAAFRKGVFNFIKEDADPTTGEAVPRKYFSGGVVGNFAMTETANPAQVPMPAGSASKLTFRIDPAQSPTSNDAITQAAAGDTDSRRLEDLLSKAKSGESVVDTFINVDGYQYIGFANTLQIELIRSDDGSSTRCVLRRSLDGAEEMTQFKMSGQLRFQRDYHPGDHQFDQEDQGLLEKLRDTVLARDMPTGDSIKNAAMTSVFVLEINKALQEAAAQGTDFINMSDDEVITWFAQVFSRYVQRLGRNDVPQEAIRQFIERRHKRGDIPKMWTTTYLADKAFDLELDVRGFDYRIEPLLNFKDGKIQFAAGYSLFKSNLVVGILTAAFDNQFPANSAMSADKNQAQSPNAAVTVNLEVDVDEKPFELGRLNGDIYRLRKLGRGTEQATQIALALGFGREVSGETHDVYFVEEKSIVLGAQLPYSVRRAVQETVRILGFVIVPKSPGEIIVAGQTSESGKALRWFFERVPDHNLKMLGEHFQRNYSKNMIFVDLPGWEKGLRVYWAENADRVKINSTLTEGSTLIGRGPEESTVSRLMADLQKNPLTLTEPKTFKVSDKGNLSLVFGFESNANGVTVPAGQSVLVRFDIARGRIVLGKAEYPGTTTLKARAKVPEELYAGAHDVAAVRIQIKGQEIIVQPFSSKFKVTVTANAAMTYAPATLSGIREVINGLTVGYFSQDSRIRGNQFNHWASGIRDVMRVLDNDLNKAVVSINERQVIDFQEAKRRVRMMDAAGLQVRAYVWGTVNNDFILVLNDKPLRLRDYFLEKTVVAVSDDQARLELFRQELARLGAVFKPAANGTEALQHFQGGQRVDVVLILPKTFGQPHRQFAQLILKARPNTKVVLVGEDKTWAEPSVLTLAPNSDTGSVTQKMVDKFANRAMTANASVAGYPLSVEISPFDFDTTGVRPVYSVLVKHGVVGKGAYIARDETDPQAVADMIANALSSAVLKEEDIALDSDVVLGLVQSFNIPLSSSPMTTKGRLTYGNILEVSQLLSGTSALWDYYCNRVMLDYRTAVLKAARLPSDVEARIAELGFVDEKGNVDVRLLDRIRSSIKSPSRYLAVVEDISGSQESAEKALSGRHILIVDDNEREIAELSKVLEGTGANVTSASDGREALEKIRSLAPDLVITDQNMSGMNGEELVKSLKNGSVEEQAIPVVMWTRNVLTEVLAIRKRLGIGVIRKGHTFALLSASAYAIDPHFDSAQATLPGQLVESLQRLTRNPFVISWDSWDLDADYVVATLSVAVSGGKNTSIAVTQNAWHFQIAMIIGDDVQTQDELLAKVADGLKDHVINDAIQPIVNKIKQLYAAALPNAAMTAEEVLKDKIILIVDDDDKVLKNTKKVLSPVPGIILLTARNGAEALEILRNRPDINAVISDINMPVMDGFALIDEIRKTPTLQNLPVVMRSYSIRPNDYEWAKGARVFLQDKTIWGHRVLDLLAKAIDPSFEDHAMSSTGGIDLRNGEYLKVIDKDASGLPVFDPAQIQKLKQDLRGFVPVPIGVPQPVDLRQLLGLADNATLLTPQTADATATPAIIPDTALLFRRGTGESASV